MRKENYGRFLRGEILTKWTLLDSDAVDRWNGEPSKIVDLLSARYGFSAKRASRELNRVEEELSEKLKRAA
jgi:hypothetical protein